jgi:hypothetical protein
MASKETLDSKCVGFMGIDKVHKNLDYSGLSNKWCPRAVNILT